MRHQVLRAVWSGVNADALASIAPVSGERGVFCSGSLIRIGAANLIKIGHVMIRLALGVHTVVGVSPKRGRF
jgi:hypothetical protein